MSNYNIQSEYSLCAGESPFLYAHPEHKITVSISDKDYTKMYRSNVRWDFGDGYIVEAPEASHSYAKDGYYTIHATLYGTDGSINTNIVSTKSILVKSVIPTELSFSSSDSTWNNKINTFISKNLFLGEIQLSLSTNVISEPKIAAYYRQNKDNFNIKNYFEIKDESFYHLKRYFTFLEETSSFIPDLDNSFTTVLKPTQKFTPTYITLFAKLSRKSETSNLPQISFYYVADKEYHINFKPFKNKAGERLTSDEVNYIFCSDESEIPFNAYKCGKVGFANIWYKNDYATTNDIIFEIEKASLKLNNEEALKESYLNIPPLGFTFETYDNENLKDNENVIKVLTNNGLYSRVQDNKYPIDIYLKHNFYANHKVEGYYSYFIKNDSLAANEESYNMLKSTNIDINSLTIFCDNEKCILENTNSNDEYYKKYYFTPLNPFKIKENNNKIIFECNKLVDFKDIILPVEKQHNENLDEILDTYMGHPLFGDAENLKIFLRDSLKNNGLFDRIINKGNNFIDDHINIKTCYINNLLDIYSMLNEPITKYNLTSFERVNELKDLMRILSMNYSNIFGNIIENDYDISINNFSQGKNVGDKIEFNDIILCDENYNIIALKRENKIYKLQFPVPYIIVKDNFSFKTYLASFYGIETPILESFDDQNEEWLKNNNAFISSVKYAYSLDNYNYKWAWSLNLPEETKSINDKSRLINNFYSFYLFNHSNTQTRKYNFIEESSIPTDDLGKQINVEDWNDKFGFTYDCIVKVLQEKLNGIK